AAAPRRRGQRRSRGRSARAAVDARPWCIPSARIVESARGRALSSMTAQADGLGDAAPLRTSRAPSWSLPRGSPVTRDGSRCGLWARSGRRDKTAEACHLADQRVEVGEAAAVVRDRDADGEGATDGRMRRCGDAKLVEPHQYLAVDGVDGRRARPGGAIAE